MLIFFHQSNTVERSDFRFCRLHLSLTLSTSIHTQSKTILKKRKIIKKNVLSQAWRCTTVIPELGRLR
jgi:hypothetical protein